MRKGPIRQVGKSPPSLTPKGKKERKNTEESLAGQEDEILEQKEILNRWGVPAPAGVGTGDAIAENMRLGKMSFINRALSPF
jgi:hypothetical protein